MRHWLLPLLALGLLTGACSKEQTARPAIRMGLAQAIITLDPRFSTDANSARINRLLYQRLVDIDAQYRPTGELAQGWTLLSPTHYRFRLRPARFSDGSTLSARDVLATYHSILAPNSRSPLKGQLEVIDSISAPGESQVDFILKCPDPLFPMRLNIGILPAQAIAAGRVFSKSPLGSGSFRFVAWPSPERLVLERLRDGRQFEFLTVSDPTVRALKLQRGEIDLLQNDLPVELLRYLEQKGMQVEHGPGSRYSYLGFNLRDPLLSQLSVREAISLAIDRESLAHYLFAHYARPAWGPMPLGHWAGPLSGQAPAYDPARARALLDAAGLKDPDGPGPRPRFVLEYKTSTDPLRLRVATVLQSQLAQIGVQLHIRSLDWGTFYGDVKAGRFQLYSLSWVGIESPDFYREAYHSQSVPPKGANRGQLRDPQLDADIEQALAQNPQSTAAYQAVQARLQAVQAYAPLWFEDNVAVLRPGLRHYRINMQGDFDGLITLDDEHAH